MERWVASLKFETTPWESNNKNKTLLSHYIICFSEVEFLGKKVMSLEGVW